MSALNYILIVSLVAFALAWIVYTPVLNFAKAKNIFDNPDARKLQRRPIPVLGGTVVLISSLLAVQLAWLGFDCTCILATEAAMVVMLVLGTTDDLKGLSPAVRFAVQIAVALMLMWINDYKVDSLHGLWGIYELNPYVAYPLTVFAVVGIINAVNMIDGVNGLSSGLCMTVCGFYALLLYNNGQFAPAILAMATVGALVPFFIHNVFGGKSRMFIGDGGTMLLGILLSDLVIRIMHIPDTFDNTKFGVVAFVVAVMAIPLGDTLRVMTARILHHTSPFHPDKTHLHHAFIRYGFTHLETSLMEIILNSGIVGIWWLSYKAGAGLDVQLYIVVVAGFAVTIGLYYLLGRKERLAAKHAAQGLPVDKEEEKY